MLRNEHEYPIYGVGFGNNHPHQIIGHASDYWGLANEHLIEDRGEFQNQKLEVVTIRPGESYEIMGMDRESLH
jgi:hypothetical protein